MENHLSESITNAEKLSFDNFREEVLADYKLVCISREASLMGRKEVLTGKAKFGIFGGGKELPQVAMAKFFQPGDFYSGYYRDQTFAFATGVATVEQLFSQLYADPDLNNEPHSGGRQMSSHFASPNVNENGEFIDFVNKKNLAAGLAPTAAQMPKALGLAYASKSFRNIPELNEFTSLSNKGNEVCFSTIGDASTSEGHFWETVNAAGVLQVPLAIFVWDDGYGISVPKEFQTTKSSISEALSGMQKEKGTNGINIYKVKGWDYAGMCQAFEEGIRLARETHTPVLFHVEELIQPQGHSTSGSHERYKSEERLAWERDWDCMKKMKEWILANALANSEEMDTIEENARTYVKEKRTSAWEKYVGPIRKQALKAGELINGLSKNLPGQSEDLKRIADQVIKIKDPLRKDIMQTLHAAVSIAGNNDAAFWVKDFYREQQEENKLLYNSCLYNEGAKSALKAPIVKPVYDTATPAQNGYVVLNNYFDLLFAANPKVVAFGEDLGNIGDVNQGFSGLQAKYGEGRIFDTGIRELTIMGKAIGLAYRGLRPIAEIQYLDYLLYGLEPLSDDLATMHYRTRGQQSAPVIIRTRGHRLEGIWHSGSPMGVVINALRGMYVCVPRNMVQAAGMYNTLLLGNDPAIVIECLNGYRLKEKAPANLLEFTVPLGVPEVIKEGNDVTIVTYGSTVRIVQEAAANLENKGVSCEIIDVQTLLPFDINHKILESLKKTNRIVFVDEDVPGGAAGYMFNKVMEEQGGYRWLDVAPRTITGKPHRAAYGSDGDYFSKPNTEDIVSHILEMMQE